MLLSNATLNSIILALDVYNNGLLHCNSINDNTEALQEHLMPYLGLLLVLWITLAFLCEGKFLLGNLIFAMMVTTIMYCVVEIAAKIEPGSSVEIYRYPKLAAVYGCAQQARPIPLTPLFIQPEVFAGAYNERGFLTVQSGAEALIDALRAAAVKHYTLSNCSC